MDNINWSIILSAFSVIITLGSLIVGTYFSLAKKIQGIDSRLSHLEGGFEERGKWQTIKLKEKFKNRK